MIFGRDGSVDWAHSMDPLLLHDKKNDRTQTSRLNTDMLQILYEKMLPAPGGLVAR